MSRGRALSSGKLVRRGDQYVLDYSNSAGKRKRIGLGTDRRIAEKRRVELIRRRDMELDGLGSREGQAMHISEVLDEYLEDLPVRVTSRHAKNVRQKLERLVAELDDPRVRDLRQVDLIRVRNRLLKDGLSNRTASLYATVMKAMLNWAVQAGLIAENPVANLKPLPSTRDHQRYKRRALSEEEIDRFLAAVQRDDERNGLLAIEEGWSRVPQHPFFKAMLETGARYKELRLAAWGDLDFPRRILVVRAENAKARKSRAIPLRESFVEELRRLQAIHHRVLGRIPASNDPIFMTPEGCLWRWDTTNPRRILSRCLRAAKIPSENAQGERVDLHALRHTMASRLARSGAPLVKAQRILGHSDPKLTAAIYSHLDVEELRGAIEHMDRDAHGIVRDGYAEAAR